MADEPVSAWPEPLTVKTRRWISRHRTAVSGTAAAILVASITFGIATFLLARANRQLDDANHMERLARSNEETQKNRAEESYRIARKGLENSLAIRDDERLQLGKMEGIRKQLAKAGADFYQEFANLRGDEPSFRFDRALAYGQLAAETAYLGDHDVALSDYERAVDILEGLTQDDTNNLEYLDALHKHYNDWGVGLLNLKRLRAAGADRPGHGGTSERRTDRIRMPHSLRLTQGALIGRAGGCNNIKQRITRMSARLIVSGVRL